VRQRKPAGVVAAAGHDNLRGDEIDFTRRGKQVVDVIAGTAQAGNPDAGIRDRLPAFTAHLALQGRFRRQRQLDACLRRELRHIGPGQAATIGVGHDLRSAHAAAQRFDVVGHSRWHRDRVEGKSPALVAGRAGQHVAIVLDARVIESAAGLAPENHRRVGD
jgi:hypothetical protein